MMQRESQFESQRKVENIGKRKEESFDKTEGIPFLHFSSLILFQTLFLILERRYRRLAFFCQCPPRDPPGVISDLQRFVYAVQSKGEVLSKDTNVGRCYSVKNSQLDRVRRVQFSFIGDSSNLRQSSISNVRFSFYRLLDEYILTT